MVSKVSKLHKLTRGIVFIVVGFLCVYGGIKFNVMLSSSTVLFYSFLIASIMICGIITFIDGCVTLYGLFFGGSKE